VADSCCHLANQNTLLVHFGTNIQENSWLNWRISSLSGRTGSEFIIPEHFSILICDLVGSAENAGRENDGREVDGPIYTA